SAATVEEAANLDYVLLAVPWKNVEATLRGLPEWKGRVLIDATNPFAETSPNLVLAGLGGTGASEIVAGFPPGARIVKGFNSIRMARFNEGPVKGQGRRVIFVSGDDEESKRVVKDLIESFGFAAIDLGGLVTGGRIQQAGGPLAGLDLFVAAWRPLTLRNSSPTSRAPLTILFPKAIYPASRQIPPPTPRPRKHRNRRGAL